MLLLGQLFGRLAQNVSNHDLSLSSILARSRLLSIRLYPNATFLWYVLPFLLRASPFFLCSRSCNWDTTVADPPCRILCQAQIDFLLCPIVVYFTQSLFNILFLPFDLSFFPHFLCTMRQHNILKMFQALFTSFADNPCFRSTKCYGPEVHSFPQFSIDVPDATGCHNIITATNNCLKDVDNSDWYVSLKYPILRVYVYVTHYIRS